VENRSTESVQSRARTSPRRPEPACERLRILTEADLLRLLRCFGKARGRRGLSTEEAATVAAWGNATRSMNAILDAILAGGVGIDVHENGEVLFVGKKERPYAAR